MNIKFIAYIICAMPLLAGAQELTLSQAITNGLMNNYDVLVERKNIEVAENNNSWGQAGRLPTISLNVGQNNSVTDNIKTASPFQLQGSTISSSLRPSVDLNWTLFNGFKIEISKKRFEKMQAESVGNASVVISNTIQAITMGYFNVILQAQRLDEFEKQLTLSRDKYEYVKVKSELGGAVSADRLVEEGNYLTDSLSYIAQKLTLRNAKRTLNFLMAEPDTNREYLFPSTLDFDNPSYNYEDLRSKMLADNVDITKQYITQSILKDNVSLARADRYPVVGLNAGFSHTRSRVDLSNAFFPSEGGNTPGPSDPLSAVNNNPYANLSISFRLFDGGRINRAIKNAMIQEDIGTMRVEKMELSLDKDLVQTLDQYRIRKQIHEINVRRESVAQTNLDLSEAKFRNGSINSFDFRIVQNNYLGAASLRLQALYSLIESHVALMRLTGGLVETYNQ